MTMTDTQAPAPATAATAGNAAGKPVVGPGNPLTAAYCAERAADAILRAEPCPEPIAGILLSAADRWRALGEALATNPAMSRPREDNDDRHGRR